MARLERDGPPAPDAPEATALPARAWGLRLLLFAGLVALTVVAFPRERAALLVYEEGEAWRGETLRAPYDLALQKDPAQLAAEQRRLRSEVVPFVREEPGAAARVRARRDTLDGAFADLFGQYDRLGVSITRGDRGQTSADSARFEALRRQLPVALSPEAWRSLLASHISGGDSLGFSRLLDEAEGLALEISARGAVDVPRDSLRGDALYVRSDDRRTDRLVSSRSLVARDEAEALAARTFAERYPRSDARAETGAALTRALLTPAYVYLPGATDAEVRRRLRALPLTMGEVRQGEVLVARGERITPEVRRRLASLDLARAAREGAEGVTETLAGQALLAAATYLLLFLFLALLRRPIFASDRQMTAVALLVGGVVVLYGLAVRLAAIEMLAVPVAIVAILMTVMFDSRVGVFVTLTLALVGGLLLRFDLGFVFTTLFGCLLVVFWVRDVRKRGQLFGSALVLLVAYATSLGGQTLTGHLSEARFLEELANAGLHALLVLLVYPLLWLAERVFDVTTDVTLLELSGTDHPLLRELQAKAPGTFSHTLQVASLAEAAAAAVGANRLLARVGALYHDVGKMARPQYFVENQKRGENPHAAIKPHLSARIIADHVREGLDLARAYRLPPVVQAFIPMHHGTTRIEYFYRRAVEARKDGDPQIEEADFRYGGPRPTSREAAILMLADGVEAASRSLDDPSPHRIEALVGQIVEARRADGQLDRSPLTFDDLRVVRETLTRALVAHYHARVKYPGGTDEPRPKRRRSGIDGS